MKMQIESSLRKESEAKKLMVTNIKEFLIKAFNDREQYVSLEPEESDGITFSEFREIVHEARRQAGQCLAKEHAEVKGFGYGIFDARKVKNQNKLLVEIRIPKEMAK